MALDIDILRPYNQEAKKLADQYESKCFEEIHTQALPFIPSQVSQVLDIGAGSGRDAAWFAAHDHNVIAIEPSIKLRQIAESIHPSRKIKWMDDHLPSLDKTSGMDIQFDLIWLSAIWMHLTTDNRQQSLNTLKRLLSSNGRIMVSLRHGNPPKNRKIFTVSLAELEHQAKKTGFRVIFSQETEDSFKREDVWWQTVVLEHARND